MCVFCPTKASLLPFLFGNSNSSLGHLIKASTCTKRMKESRLSSRRSRY
jgi:hypothetical protein